MEEKLFNEEGRKATRVKYLLSLSLRQNVHLLPRPPTFPPSDFLYDTEPGKPLLEAASKPPKRVVITF